MAKKYVVVKGKKTAKEAVKSAMKIASQFGLGKVIKVTEPKDRVLQSLVAEEAFESTFRVEFESTVTEERAGKLTLSVIGGDTEVVVATGNVDPLKHTVMAAALDELGLVD